MTSQRRRLMTGAATGALALWELSGTAQAQAWPEEPAWEVLYCGKDPSFDPRRDAPLARGARDVVGDAKAPALYTASDTEFIYFRMRVDQNPQVDDVFEPFGWAVQLDHDVDRSDYESVAIVDGSSVPQQVWFLRNTRQEHAYDPADLPEVTVANYPVLTHARVVVAEEDPKRAFGGDPDYFVDLALPLEDLTAEGVDLDGVISVVMGTSSYGRSIDSDVACHDARAGSVRWSRASSRGIRPDGRSLADSDGDGLSDVEETRIGTDSRVDDSDGDGYSDADEIRAGSDPNDKNDTPEDVTQDGVMLRGGGGPAGGCNTAPFGPFAWWMALPWLARRRRRPNA